MKIKSNSLFGLLRLVFAFAMLAFLCLFAMPAQADVEAQNVGITNTITANNTTTANLGSGIVVKNDRTLGAELRLQGNAAGTGAITVIFARSTDNGTTYETTPRFTWATALNGTTAVVARTNLPSWFIENSTHIKVVSIQNADASAGGTNAALYVSRQR